MEYDGNEIASWDDDGVTHKGRSKIGDVPGWVKEKVEKDSGIKSSMTAVEELASDVQARSSSQGALVSQVGPSAAAGVAAVAVGLMGGFRRLSVI